MPQFRSGSLRTIGEFLNTVSENKLKETQDEGKSAESMCMSWDFIYFSVENDSEKIE